MHFGHSCDIMMSLVSGDEGMPKDSPLYVDVLESIDSCLTVDATAHLINRPKLPRVMPSTTSTFT